MFIISLAVLKITIHFLTFENFELHRDAYLYYAQSQHLAWGYLSVPPTTALIGKIATSIFGNTIFALRFFPALVGGLNIIILGLAVKEIGGSIWAIALACLAYILSPSYLHSNFLFQPVAFNHFYWILLMYLAILLIRRNNPKIWIWIGIAFGLGFLNKYSIVFLGIAFVLALLISTKRNLFYSRFFLLALILVLLIILPNLLWQYQNNWPVLVHMSELRSTQLIHVRYSDFLIAQVFMNIQAILIWIGALIFLLFVKKEAQYRTFAFTYIFVILLIMAGNGKPYYALGVYPILFVFGAFLFEKYVKRYSNLVMASLLIFMLFALRYSFYYDGVPFITAEKMQREGAFRWEDGLYYDIPQDMADMTGWKEIATVVCDFYLNLEPEIRDESGILCSHYGQAGSIMFYGKDRNIPQPISTNASFLFWTPDSITINYLIYVHSDLNNDFKAEEELPKQFEKVTLIKTIDNPHFRENGTQIYWCEMPHLETREFYKSMVRNLKNKYR